ncbi:protein BNIP5 [Pteronotus mesoamericanus]|uniref:protein BNIP5 n=1 Tax=Pteronotus mesoamericanus TaxID=1884717 RepID=UPI0023EE1C4E|nr:protein BNIP5 [Pteronotus parnellii mesoamericanus]
MECPQGPRKPLSGRKARSLDRPPNSRKDSELWDCQYLSLPATPSRPALPRSTSDGSGCPKSPGSSEAPGATGRALSQEGTKEFLPSEQRALQDTKKDKAQNRAQQGLLKTVLNFFLRKGPEETKEKANRRAKGKEGFPQPTETSESREEPALKKKAHDKKASHKKHGHKKHVDEETKVVQDQEVEGQEAVLPKTAAASCSEETDLGPGSRGGEDSDLHQSLLIEGRDAGPSAPSSQATGHWQEEDLKKLDQETIIRMIVQVLREVGDQWEGEQLLVSQPEVAPQNPAPAFRKKSQEKKSNLKRTVSHKKHSSEEPKRAGAADVVSPESRLRKRPSFLYLCVGGHRPSISSSLGLEEPEVQEALPTDCAGPSLSTQAGSRGPREDLQLDRASECKKFIEKIIALLQDEEEQEGEKQLHVQEPEVAVEHLTPPCRKKSQEKKSSFRKAFSHKKHSSKEPKKGGAAGATSPESRLLKRPSYLPLCVGGRRPSISSSLDLEGLEFQESSPAEGGRVGSSEASSQARGHKLEERPLPDGACESKELIIQKLVALLQEVDGHLGEQIRRHPSFKRFFYQLPDSSLIKLTATLRRQGARSPESNGNAAKRPYQFAFGLANKFAGNNHHTVLSLMGLRYPQFPYREAPQTIISPETQSPD